MLLNLFSLAVFLTAVIGGWIVIFRRIRLIPPSAIVCGQCGLPAILFKSFRCPTCSTDSRNCGLIRRPSERVQLLSWACIAMVLTMLIVCVGVAVINGLSLGRGMLEESTNGELVPNDFQTGRTLAGLSHIKYRIACRSAPGTFVTGTLVVTVTLENGSASDLRVELPSMSYQIDRAAPVSSKLTGAIVANWIRAAGVKADDDILAETAREIFAPIERHSNWPMPTSNDFFELSVSGQLKNFTGTAGPLRFGGGTSGSHSVWPDSVTSSLLLFAAGTWLVVLRRILPGRSAFSALKGAR